MNAGSWSEITESDGETAGATESLLVGAQSGSDDDTVAGFGLDLATGRRGDVGSLRFPEALVLDAPYVLL